MCDAALAVTTANAQVPNWDAILVVVNSTEYGGSGGQVATYSLAPAALEIALHEMGHSAFDLADEYEYYAGCSSGEAGHDQHAATEPTEPNVTIETDRAKIKWRHLIAAATTVPTTINADCTKCDPQANPVAVGTIGLFTGAHYAHCGAFRPAFDCRMRTIGQPFCSVCQERIRAKLAATTKSTCFVATAVYGERRTPTWKSCGIGATAMPRPTLGGGTRCAPSSPPTSASGRRWPGVSSRARVSPARCGGRSSPRSHGSSDDESESERTMPDTAAGLVAELGKLLSPLEQSLQSAERTSALFAELGLPLPPQVRDAPQVVSAAGAAATAIAQLPPLTAALVVALAAGDQAAVAAALAQLAPKATDAFSKTFDVATKVKAAFEGIPGLAPELQEIVAELPERLVDYLVVAYLEGTRPVLARTLALAGIADSPTEPASGSRPSYLRRELRLDHLSQLFDDPAALAQDLYGWGAPDIDDALLLGRLGDLLTAVNLPATYDPTTHELSALIFRLREAPGPQAALDVELGLSDLTGVDQHIAIGRGDWTIHITGQGALAVGAGLRITPPLTVTPLQAGVAADATFKVALERGGPGGAPFVLFGDAAGTRFEATSVSVGAGPACHRRRRRHRRSARRRRRGQRQPRRRPGRRRRLPQLDPAGRAAPAT